MDAPVLTAVISSASALLVVGATAGLGYWSKRQLDRRVDRLETQQHEDDAWRAYTFDARKRLYEGLGPLLFALVEACEEVEWRVKGIARSAREGRLEDGPGNRFRPGSDYMLSTLYRLMAPVAITRLVQGRLTLVDLSVDPAVDRIYSLAKALRRTWNAGRDLSQLRGLPYQPFGDGKTRESAKQHINLQAVDALVDHLIPARTTENGGALLRFSAFVACYRDDVADVRAAVEPFERLLDRFHPDRRPVLWQMLRTQGLLAATIARNAAHGATGWDTSGRPLTLPQDVVEWRGSAADDARRDDPRADSAAALAYIRSRLPSSLFDGAAQDGSRPAIPRARSNAEDSADTVTSGPYQPPSRPI